MTESRRIAGIILLGIALLFAFRIPQNLHSTDPRAQNHVHVDYVLVFIFGGSGLVLLLSRSKAGATGDATRKRANPRSIAVQGLAIIVASSVFSFRNVVLFAGKTIVNAQVIEVDHPSIPASGRAIYHVTYQFNDSAGIARTDKDFAISPTPILASTPIEVAYSPYRPQISRIASNVTRTGIYLIGLGLLYEIWALALLMRPAKPAAQPAGVAS